MEIEVKYDELYTLSDYLLEKSEELKEDQKFIDSISNSLSEILHGLGEQALAYRIKNYNATQFNKVVKYTGTLGNELKAGAKLYNSEDSDFEQKMNREASKYVNS
ncbi:MAG: hypothetical protein PHD02_02575 [Bacilli bacterium]|nr:hypothetical protein [Bacilli bacterium]